MSQAKHIFLLVLAMIFVIVSAVKLVSGDLRGCLIVIVIGAFALPLIIKLLSRENNANTK